MNDPILDVRDLDVAFGSTTPQTAVSSLSFLLKTGETLAIVGESGSGKSVTALAIMGLLPERTARIRRGRIAFDGTDLLMMDPESLRRIRGPGIGMIFQEPMTSLNPVLSIGRQMTEGLQQHFGLDRAAATKRAVSMLDKVGIREPDKQMRRFPHEFSGGMRQRVMIASAMVLAPRILIADEPTTALDVTIQAQIMDLMRDLVKETGTSLLLITHDMGVVAQNADRVIVMKTGKMIEEGETEALFLRPRETYTKALLAAVPRLTDTRMTPPHAPHAIPALKLSHISKSFGHRGLFSSKAPSLVLNDISLTVEKGRTLALVGESGSGKSTLGRIACRLLAPDLGEIEVDGENITHLSGRSLRKARGRIQMIFQDPFASLDPRFSIGRTLAEPLTIRGVEHSMINAEVAKLLDMVRLPTLAQERFPHQFSGGQRQRIAIARALAADPSIIVADEPTSALDVSIQAEILSLLKDIQREEGISYLFITHDLAVVANVAHSMAVMKSGRIIEHGSVSKVLANSSHPYTQALLSAVPVPDPTVPRATMRPADDTFPTGEIRMIEQDHWVMS